MHTCIIRLRIVQSHSHQLQAILSHKLAIAQRNFVENVNHADGPQIQQDIILTSDIITDMNISAKSPQSTSALQRSRLVQARPSDWKIIEESLHERTKYEQHTHLEGVISEIVQNRCGSTRTRIGETYLRTMAYSQPRQISPVLQARL